MMAVQPLAEHPLADRDRCISVRSVKTSAAPRFVIAFDDEGRKSVFEAIAVRLEYAELVLHEEECERVERARRTEPDEVRRAHVEMWLEYRCALAPDRAIDAVGSDYEIRVLAPADRVECLDTCDVAIEAYVHAERRGPPVQDVEQSAARYPAEAVSARGYRPVVNDDVDVVPVREMLDDAAIRFGVRIAEVLERLVREDDSPP